MSKYNEPWAANIDRLGARDGWINGADNAPVVQSGDYGVYDAVWSEGALNRALACVNACAPLGEDPAAVLAAIRDTLAAIIARDEPGDLVDREADAWAMDGMAAEDGWSAGAATADRACADLARAALSLLTPATLVPVAEVKS